MSIVSFTFLFDFKKLRKDIKNEIKYQNELKEDQKHDSRYQDIMDDCQYCLEKIRGYTEDLTDLIESIKFV